MKRKNQRKGFALSALSALWGFENADNAGNAMVECKWISIITLPMHSLHFCTFGKCQNAKNATGKYWNSVEGVERTIVQKCKKRKG